MSITTPVSVTENSVLERFENGDTKLEQTIEWKLFQTKNDKFTEMICHSTAVIASMSSITSRLQQS
jgi:hypothetical protein